MKKLAITAAAVAFASVAYAQKAPVEPSSNLDASTSNQVELQEPKGEAKIPVDLGVTKAIKGEGADIKDSPKYDANTKNSGNLEGK